MQFEHGLDLCFVLPDSVALGIQEPDVAPNQTEEQSEFRYKVKVVAH